MPLHPRLTHHLAQPCKQYSKGYGCYTTRHFKKMHKLWEAEQLEQCVSSDKDEEKEAHDDNSSRDTETKTTGDFFLRTFDENLSDNNVVMKENENTKKRGETTELLLPPSVHIRPEHPSTTLENSLESRATGHRAIPASSDTTTQGEESGHFLLTEDVGIRDTLNHALSAGFEAEYQGGVDDDTVNEILLDDTGSSGSGPEPAYGAADNEQWWNVLNSFGPRNKHLDFTTKAFGCLDPVEYVCDMYLRDGHSRSDKLMEGDYESAFARLGKTVPTYAQVQSKLKMLGVPMVKIDVCPNECVLFYGEHKALETCPTCASQRYKRNGAAEKQAYYFSIQRTLEKFWQLPEFRENLTYHHEQRLNTLKEAEDTGSETTQMRDIWDSSAWIKQYIHPCRDLDKDPCPDVNHETCYNPQNVALCLSTDGTPPFKKGEQNYSLWPVNLMVMNLPHELRTSFKYTITTAILPGPQQPKDLNMFLEPITDELLHMWRTGFHLSSDSESSSCSARGSEDNEDVGENIKGILIFAATDHKAAVKMWDTVDVGSKISGCHICNGCDGKWDNTKTIYRDQWKSLPRRNKVRAICWRAAYHRADDVEKARLQKEKDVLWVSHTNQDYLRYGKDPIKHKDTGFNGLCAFSRLPYFDYRVHQGCDAMHTLSGVIKMLVWEMAGTNKKKKARGKRKRGEAQAPQLPHRVSRECLKRMRAEIEKCSLNNDLQASCVKKALSDAVSCVRSADWIHFVDIFGKLVFRHKRADGGLSDQVREVWFRFCDIVSDLLKIPISQEEAPRLQLRLREVIAQIEMVYPSTCLTVLLHKLGHLGDLICSWGPLFSTWMFGFERLMKQYKSLIRTPKNPSAALANRTQIQSAASSIMEAHLDNCAPCTRLYQQVDLVRTRQPMGLTINRQSRILKFPASSQLDSDLTFADEEGLHMFFHDNYPPYLSLWSQFTKRLSYSKALKEQFRQWGATQIHLSEHERELTMGFDWLSRKYESTKYSKMLCENTYFVSKTHDERRQYTGAYVSVPSVMDNGQLTMYYGHINYFLVLRLAEEDDPTVLINATWYLGELSSLGFPFFNARETQKSRPFESIECVDNVVMVIPRLRKEMKIARNMGKPKGNEPDVMPVTTATEGADGTVNSILKYWVVEKTRSRRSQPSRRAALSQLLPRNVYRYAEPESQV